MKRRIRREWADEAWGRVRNINFDRDETMIAFNPVELDWIISIRKGRRRDNDKEQDLAAA